MAHSHGDLLAEALEVWEATRAQVFADAVDRLTAAVLAEAKPVPSPATAEDFHDRWFKQLLDPAGRGRAAAQLFAQLPGDNDGECADALASRMRSLYRVGPDPRAGHEIAKAFAAEDGLLGYIAARRAAEQVLLECRDDRMRAVLSAVVTDDELRAQVIRRVLDAPALGRKPRRRELDRFATALSPRTAAVAEVGALLAEVYAHPADDAPRAVLADALQAQGDPRGEFIALQLASALQRADIGDAARDKRIDQLVQACGLEWLDELQAITYRAQFQRGFVTRLELAKSYAEISPGLHTVPALATVEELIPGEARGDAYASLLTSPAMKVLRRIQIYDGPSLAALPKAPATIDHVSCPWLKRGGGNYLAGLTSRVFPECIRRGVTSIGIGPKGLPALMASPLRGRLTSLTIGDPGDPVQIAAVWDTLPRDCELIVNRWGELEECLAVRVAWLGDLRLVRDGKRVIARVWGDMMIQGLIDSLDELPPLAVLIVEGASAAQEKQLVTAAKKYKVAVELQPARRRTGYLTIKR